MRVEHPFPPDMFEQKSAALTWPLKLCDGAGKWLTRQIKQYNHAGAPKAWLVFIAFCPYSRDNIFHRHYRRAYLPTTRRADGSVHDW